VAALLVTAAGGLQALNPHKQISQYGHLSWTGERGLPGEAVYQILQTRDGYLWIRTGSALAHFDGVRFVSVDAEIGPEPAKAICLGADGDLLIRTATRTLIYKDRKFSDYLPPASWSVGPVRAIFESREHVVFVGGDDRVYRIEKDGKPTILRDHTGWIKAFLEDHTGKIWIAGSPSIYLYQNDTLTEALDRTASPNTASALSEDRQHRIWVTTTNGLYQLHAEGPRLEPVHRNGVIILTAFLEDAQGNLWAGTERLGLIRFGENGFSALGAAAGLTDNDVLSLFEDREGSIWIGTISGLDQLRDGKVTSFTAREGLASNLVKSVLIQRDGTVDVFSDGGGLARIKNGIATPFQHNDRLKSVYGTAMYESRDGSLWLGTYGGLSRVQGDKVTVYDREGHFSSNYISAISEDGEGLIVTNAEPQAFRFENGKVLPYTVRGKKTLIADSDVYTFTIYRDPSSALWFGTARGLFKAPDDEHPEGSWEPKIDFDVTSIFDDGHGSLWLGGRTPGLTQYRIRDRRVTRYTKRDGLFDTFASCILSGGDGNLWISAEDGIYSVSQQDLDDFAEGRTKSVSSRKYGLADGMKTAEGNATNQPAGGRTPDGKLWFTTKKGVVAVDPGHMDHNDLIPPVMVESVVADGVAQPLSGGLRIAPGTREMEIDYTALSLRIPERVRFKYQLEGYDRDWVDAGSRRVAYYTKLPPGEYRFRVVAANDDGVWNQEGASVNLVLKPHFYQTRFFVFLCVLLTLLIVFAANRLSTRLIRARAVQLRRLVEERTAELLKSQLELQQLAHFDALTALPNRRMFTEEFGMMCGENNRRSFSLLLVDVDRFKSINDTYGHDAGDEFLVGASKRLESEVRTTDRVARLGGDEFAILLAGDPAEARAQSICERILKGFSAPVSCKGVNVQATVSIGVAVFPDHGENQEKLYKSADLALYEAKRLGRNRWCWYRPGLRDDGR